MCGLALGLLAGADPPDGAVPPLPTATPAPPTDPHENGLGLGPLRLCSQSPGQSLRLGLVPHTPAELAAGEWKLHAGSTWVNVWASEQHYELDYEALTSEAVVSYGISDRWGLELGATNHATFGGHLDGAIQKFHSVFGLDQDGRDQVPRDRTHVRIDPTSHQNGVELDEEELDGNRTNFLRGAALCTLCHGEDGWPAVAVVGTLQAPLGSRRGYDGGILDVSLDLSVAERLGDWVIYASVACTRFAADEVYGIHLHRTNWAGLGAIEYRLTGDWSLVVQYLLSEGVAPDLYVFSKPSHELAVGTQVRLDRQVTLQFGVIENVFVFDNSPDFGLHLALEVRL